jgi:hypothetical protein
MNRLSLFSLERLSFFILRVYCCGGLASLTMLDAHSLPDSTRSPLFTGVIDDDSNVAYPFVAMVLSSPTLFTYECAKLDIGIGVCETWGLNYIFIHIHLECI